MIKLDKVDLDFPVKLAASNGQTANVGGAIVGDGKRRVVKALDQISIVIGEGERVGIIGRNGSGKSTMLRLCAGIYVESRGCITISGQVSTLFTSNLGMSLYQTGRKSIELGLKLQGLARREIRDAVEEITAFSELGEYIDLPLLTYSSGMRTRLGFAIATQTKPDILLVDEVFGAGDMIFVDKAKARLAKFMEGANILLLSSHSLGIIERLCDRVLWLNQGKLMMDGPTADVLGEYRSWVAESQKS